MPLLRGSRVLSVGDVQVELQKSAGVPYKYLGATKGMFLSIDPQPVYHMWEMAGVGSQQDPPVWQIFVKEEPVKREKLEKGDFRVITSPPVDLFYLGAMLCQDFNSRMTAHWFDLPSKVGFSKFYGGSQALFDSLRLDEEHEWEAVDFVRFDSGILATVFDHIKVFRWDCYHPEHQTPQNRNRLDFLYESIVNTVMMLPDGEVVQKDHGQPSGSPNTTYDNTLIHFWCLAYAWARLVDEDLTHFTKGARFALYGDDELVCIAKRIIPQYGWERRSQALREVGLNSPPLKCKRSAEITDMDFLGGFFRKLRGYDIGDLLVQTPNRAKLVCSALYPVEKQTADQQFSRLLALRVEAYFDDELRSWLDRLLAHYQRLGVKLVPLPDSEIALSIGLLTDQEILSLWLGLQSGTSTSGLPDKSAMQVHGNYCGPHWSAGRRDGDPFDETVEAVDALDAACQEHDRTYASYARSSGHARAVADFKLGVDSFGAALRGAPLGKSLALGAGMLTLGFLGKLGLNPYTWWDTSGVDESIEPDKFVEYDEEMAKNKRGHTKSKAPAGRRRPQVRMHSTRAPPAGRSAAVVAAPTAVSETMVARFASRAINHRTHGVGLNCVGIQYVMPTPDTTTMLMVDMKVNPTALAGRIAQMAPLYEKYRFNRLHFHYVPRCATTNVGSIAGCFELDPSDTPPTTSAFQYVLGHNGAVTNSVWQSATYTMPRPKSDLTVYYVNQAVGTAMADIRMEHQCRFIMAKDVVAILNYVPGNLWVAYDVDFFQPCTTSTILLPRDIAPDLLSDVNSALRSVLGNNYRLLGQASYSATDYSTTSSTSASTTTESKSRVPVNATSTGTLSLYGPNRDQARLVGAGDLIVLALQVGADGRRAFGGGWPIWPGYGVVTSGTLTQPDPNGDMGFSFTFSTPDGDEMFNGVAHQPNAAGIVQVTGTSTNYELVGSFVPTGGGLSFTLTIIDK